MYPAGKPSFFNLHVELLLEGLDCTLLSQDYVFHGERGYGREYWAEDMAPAAKEAFLQRTSRDRRKMERDRNLTLSKEEKKRLSRMEDRRLVMLLQLRMLLFIFHA